MNSFITLHQFIVVAKVVSLISRVASSLYTRFSMSFCILQKKQVSFDREVEIEKITCAINQRFHDVTHEALNDIVILADKISKDRPVLPCVGITCFIKSL